jgi:hypothetical protein
MTDQQGCERALKGLLRQAEATHGKPPDALPR